ncbi:cytochrome C [Archangium violaceum]|uniref:cytochrome C n=1 Tax=Archangium violaceum TaxID=83451 RepID=UPI001951F3A2|nr:cytochrome C [Archangium violaceum]QRN96262.1 cytochrome C [Archangium violaceum]
MKGIRRGVWLAALALLGTGCGEREALELAPGLVAQAQAQTEEAQADTQTEDLMKPRPVAKPVGLALEVDNGVGTPLRVRAGQTFFINQIDLRAAITATEDRGVDGLRRTGDFASLAWQGTALADADPTFSLNADQTTYTRRRFYRSSHWMQKPSIITVMPVDARGRPTGRVIPLNLGSEDRRKFSDDFFIRRMRAIQWTRDCGSATSCAGAHAFEEEALVEVRNARTGATTFSLSPDTRALLVDWTARSGAPYRIPVEQVQSSTWSYGFNIDITPVTPPRADGTYAPGSEVTFRMTFRDGAGKRLHPEGSLPTYNEFLSGQVESGLQYYRGFSDAATTYYRRKHRECNLSASIIGPAQSIQPLRNIVEMEDFLGPEESISIGTPERDGVYAQAMTVPPANKLFGGAYDPTHAGWDAPVRDTFTNKLPLNAEPGTYLVTVKARRIYLGEDVAASRTIEIQVGTRQHTEVELTTGKCATCHTEGGELGKVLHALDNRATCATCHAPLAFELEGPIAVRTHFVHSRGRFDAPLQQCSSCHVKQETTQRTSKSACLSCHTSYPESHVQKFGPIQHMYVGGGRESFQQCTGACHKTHPGSGF